MSKRITNTKQSLGNSCGIQINIEVILTTIGDILELETSTFDSPTTKDFPADFEILEKLKTII